ncbi:MAG: hypothetical protein M3O35_10090 [Acidobacteriota bacterium]|nr:hypothetical protein [Acidobacteriota bacterium]
MAIDTAQLVKTGTYAAKAPLPSVVADAEQILRVIDDRQAFRRKLRRTAGICLLVAIVCGITSATIDKKILFTLVALPAFLACIGLFIYSFVYSNQMVKHRSRCQLLKDLAGILQQDAGSGAAFTVRLALQNCAKLISEEPWDQRKNGKQQFFEEEWLTLDGKLLDGTSFSESVTELLRKRTFTNPRGKHKTKTRTRYLLNLRFDYPAEQYGDPRLVKLPLREEIRVPQFASVRDIRVSEDAIAVKAMAIDSKELMQTSAMVSLAAYRILKSSRRLASEGGAR